MKHTLLLPERTSKPRNIGLTILLDAGLPTRLFEDYVESGVDHLDFVKFGWGTSIVSKNIEDKIKVLKKNDINFFFGGTLFEKFYSQNKVNDYLQLCKEFDCKYVEISNGTIDLSNEEKGKFIEKFSKDFLVFSEVGYKDTHKSNTLTVENWIEFITQDLNAGAYKVITEARESGQSGICQTNGSVKEDVVDNILKSGISLGKLIFEAPNKNLQTYFIEKVGSNVNLANIPFDHTIALETLRLGLRSDTLQLNNF